MSWFEDNNIGDDIAKQLLRIKFTDGENVIERDMRPDVIIDYDNLEHQLDETPAAFLFYSSMLAEAKKQVATLERTIKYRRARLAKELVDASKNDAVKLRASDIEILLDSDDNILALETKLLGAERTLSKVYAAVDAIKMKSEHLRSLAGFKKQELRDSDL